MKIEFKKSFDKSKSKLDLKIRMKFNEKLIIFSKNPFEKILNNHTLTWKYTWFRSINITWDYRAIFKEYWENKYEFVDFIDIWTHSELYW